MNTHPLLQSQLGIFLEWMNKPLATKYNLVFCTRLDEGIDTGLLADALERIVYDHPDLFMQMRMEDGTPVQWRDEDMKPNIENVTMTDDEAKRLADGAYMRPFDLLGGEPLHRFTIAHTETGNYLFMDIHHVIYDGTSQTVFLHDLDYYYRHPSHRKPLAYGLLEAAEQEQEFLGTQSYEETRKAVMDHFAACEFAPFSETGADEWLEMHEEAVAVPDGDALEAWCQANGVQVSQLFHAAFTLALTKMMRRSDFCYQAEYAGRTADTKTNYGMYVKGLPMHIDVDYKKTVAQYLADFRTEWRFAKTQCADYPLTHFYNDLHGLPSVKFNFLGRTVNMTESVIDGKPHHWHYCRNMVTDSDLNVEIFGTDGGYAINANGCPARLSPALLHTVAKAIEACLHNIMTAGLNAPLKDIEITSAEERTQLLALSQGALLAVDPADTYVSLFMRQAGKTPQNIAVADESGHYTYAQLDNLSGSFASHLVNIGAGKGESPFVSIMLGYQKEFLVAAIGIEKAGCAYVPLDYDYPNDRLLYMLEDSESQVLVTSHAIFDEKNAGGDFDSFKGQVVFIDDFLSPLDGSEPNATNLAKPESLAYMIYTSGSTGKPKGVMITQTGKAHFVQFITHEWHQDEKSHIACHASFSFDASVESLYPVLTVGGTLYPVPQEARKDFALLHEFIVKNAITGAIFTTQLGQMLLQLYPDLPMEYMVVGGEKMTVAPACKCRLINAYGPTEFTVISTFFDVEPGKEYRNIPIGRPLDNQLGLVVDTEGHLLPQGIAGELCMSGVQIARGYWHRDELTQERFCDLTIDGKAIKVYHTGDLVRYNDEGQIEYLGRIDSQVKLRGFRIELGEIETLVGQYEGVRMKSVVVRKMGGVEHLCAYYTADREIDANALKDYLSEKLTDYMVPTAYMQLDEMPLTPNGKVNTRALPEPQVEAEEMVAPQTELEQSVFNVVAELLRTDQFGVTSNLLHLGVTSIAAMRLGAKIAQEFGIQIAIKDILAKATVRSIAANIMEAKGGDTVTMQYDKREFYPLTENVRGLYLDWEINRDTTQYNIPVVYRFTDKDAARLALAAEKAVAAHPVLKAHFSVVDGETMMERRDAVDYHVCVARLEEEPMKEYFQKKVHPFNLLADDLVRIEVAQGPEAVYLFLDFHHTVFDGLSIDVLMADILAAYDGKEPQGETVTAFDYGLYEQDVLKSDAYSEAEQYYETLVSAGEVTSYPDSAVPDGVAVGTVQTVFPAGNINKVCQDNDITVNSYIQAVFALALSRLTRQSNPLYLTISGGRGASPQLMQSVGMFVKTLPMTIGVEGKTPTATFLKDVHKVLQDSYARDFFPYTHLVERFKLHAEIMCVYQGGVTETNGAEQWILGQDTTKFPLTLTVLPDAAGYRLSIEYDGMRYGEADMKVLLHAVANVAQELCQSETLHDVSLVGARQMEEILTMSVGKHLDVNPDDTFPSLFMRQAAKTPQNIAVVDGSGHYTYAQLNNLSGAFASHLVEMGIGKGESPFVCIMLGYQKEFVVAAIGIEKAGCAYIPLDYGYPTDRLLYMLEDSESKVLVTSHVVFDEKNADGDFSGFNGEILFVDDYLSQCDDSIANDTNLATPDDLAYMIYTSGSTGKPKGVMIPQRGKAQFVQFAAHEWRQDETSRICCHASFSFDTSVESLYPVLTVGGTLYPVPKEARKDFTLLNEFIRKNGITGGTFTTQLGQMLLQMYPDLPMKYLLVGGEKMTVAPECKCRLINGYGPTEFTVMSTFFDVEPGREYRNIPIGRPLYDQYGLVVDTEGHLLPPGIAGELCMGGTQIARGYWHREELTAERFCDLQLGERKMKVYHTGDLVRYNADGQIEFLGRIDSQVKLRGFRIELGEIETLIGQYEGIRMKSVVVREIGGVQHLCAYFTAEHQIDVEALKAYLAERLADYMVPTAYMQLDEMPLTPNGKANTRALPEPQLLEAQQDSFVAPEGEIENAIAECFADVLKKEKVGANDDFFKFGGTSLSAIKVVAGLMGKGYNVTYKDLFKYKTPRSLAIFIDITQNMAAPAVPTETLVIGKPVELPKSAFADVLSGNTLEALHKGEMQNIGNVLLTGATGYLGIHMLNELLQNETGTIYCVLRGKRDLTPEKRLRTLFFYYFNGIDEEVFDKHIRIIGGDLTDPHCLDQLPDDIDTVFNCAANVKHFSAGNDIEKVNVESVRLLVDWCLDHQARLVHVSTASIAGQSVDGVPAVTTLLNEHLFDYGQGLDNQYVRSKYNAENIVLTAIRDKGLGGKIMRVGNLAPRNSDGEFQINFKNNAFMGRIVALSTLGCVSYDTLDEPCEFSPIDAVCQAIRLLAKTPKEMVVFHPYNNHHVPLGDVLEILHTVGVDIQPMESEQFNEKVQEMLKDEKVVAKLQPLFAYDEANTQHVVRWLGYENSYTTQVLHRLGFRWPYTSWDYAERFVQTIHGFNYI